MSGAPQQASAGAPPPQGVYDPSMGPPPAGYQGGPPQGQYDPSMGAPPQGYQGGPPQGYQGGPPQGQYDPSMGPPPPGYQGGPPQGMYDPSMGPPPAGYQGGPPPPGYPGGPPMMGGYNPQAQAEAELAALEQKQRDRAEKDRKHDIDHMAKQMRTGARSQGDNAACANILCGWGILNGILWACPLLGDAWWNKIWHGMSVDKLTLVVGLFNLHVELECKPPTFGDTKLCNAIKPFSDQHNGNWNMAELAQVMCKEYKQSCTMMDRMALAGYAPLAALPCAAAFEVLAVLLLYFYWNGKPSGMVRKLANQCAVLAPFAGVGGFCGWLVVSPYLQELPRMWAAIAGDTEFANSSLFGLKETFTVPTGWCTMILAVVMASSAIRFFCQFTLEMNINEPDPYGFDESSRLTDQVERMYDAEQQQQQQQQAR